MRNRLLASLATGVAGLVLGAAGPAHGAVTIGETFDPGTSSCGAASTILQSASPPADTYAAPSAGVITSWSFQGGATPIQLKLKVGDPEGGNVYQVVGQSRVESAVANSLNTFKTRIPVQPGDVLGLTPVTTGPCIRSMAGYSYSYFNSDASPGSTGTYNPPVSGIQLDVSAQLEPDADNDAFGDETQDLCPTDAETHGPCSVPVTPDTDPPETIITKEPKNRSTKNNAKYKFISDEAGSTFECKIDKKPFKLCTSPKKFRVKDGKHKFRVRAIDPAGNVDPSAAKDKFRVVD